jgi:hypothetical protein
MELTKFIKETFSEDEIKQKINQKSLRKAEDRLNQKKKNNCDLSLVEELNFSDKYKIALKDEKENPFKKSENFFKKLYKLRNNIAHSKDLLDDLSFDEIIEITIETYNFINKLKRNNF